MQNINKNFIEYYILDDGRIWDVSSAIFVDNVPKGKKAGPCLDIHNKSSLEGLIDCLHFYNYPLGELKTDAEYAAEVRTERDKLIAATDYLMMPDYPLANEKREALLIYRQALRDIPTQSGFPRQIDWPIKP